MFCLESRFGDLISMRSSLIPPFSNPQRGYVWMALAQGHICRSLIPRNPVFLPRVLHAHTPFSRPSASRTTQMFVTSPAFLPGPCLTQESLVVPRPSRLLSHGPLVGSVSYTPSWPLKAIISKGFSLWLFPPLRPLPRFLHNPSYHERGLFPAL